MIVKGWYSVLSVCACVRAHTSMEVGIHNEECTATVFPYQSVTVLVQVHCKVIE